MTKWMILWVIFGVAIASQAEPLSVVHDLIRRLIPEQAHWFHLQLEDVSVPSNTGQFSISTTPCQQGSCVLISGSDPVAVSSGFHHYLKYVANCSVSWLGDQLTHLPSTGPIPLPPSAINRTTSYAYRYYFNVCTYGYSTWSWDWPRWEREIDWMALNSINMPLAFAGQEFIFHEVYSKDFNLTNNEIADLFSGPAFLPWNRMGNLKTWGGPLPHSYIQGQRQLQHKILKRMREFGMKAVLPAFSGLVPQAMTSLYPNATITNSSGWGNFPPTQYLDPTDPLFRSIQIAFLSRQAQEYGTDHLYNCDLYNEMAPLSMSTEYLQESTQGVYDAMISADNDAIWVLQGWTFLNGEWNSTTIQAVLSPVPQGRLIVLDLWSEVTPVWSQTDSYYGTNFIWNMLHNFGGRTGLYARLQQIAQYPALALQANQTSGMLVGLGLTPEAIETNPIAYDLMMENTWRGTEGIVDLTTWVVAYVSRRYDGFLPTSLFQSWELLQATVYNCNTTQMGTSGSVFASLPAFNLTQVSCCSPVAPYYDTQDLVLALDLMLQAASTAPQLAQQLTFQYDVVLLTAQAMSNMGIQILQNADIAFQEKNATAFAEAGSVFLNLLTDLDPLTGTLPLYLFGSWLENATLWAPATASGTCDQVATPIQCGNNSISSDDCQFLNCCWNDTVSSGPFCFKSQASEEQILIWNARSQVTTWGPPVTGLTEYAYKLWNGLIVDYYLPRWSQWFTAVYGALDSNQPFNETAFLVQLQEWEEGWTRRQDNPYPTSPSGDSCALAASIFARYFAS